MISELDVKQLTLWGYRAPRTVWKSCKLCCSGRDDGERGSSPHSSARMRLLIFTSLLSTAVGQELLAECFSCDDKKMKCELECVMPKEITDQMYAWPLNIPETEDVYTSCFSLCTEKRSKCSDSDTTTACKSCLTSCATTLDGAMLECVQAQSDTTTGTYGANLDACMNSATGVMDDCRSSSCSDRDKYFFGWTPDTETGTAVPGAVETLKTLRAKYQDLEARGMLPHDTMVGSSGLEMTHSMKAKKAKASMAARLGTHPM